MDRAAEWWRASNFPEATGMDFYPWNASTAQEGKALVAILHMDKTRHWEAQQHAHMSYTRVEEALLALPSPWLENDGADGGGEGGHGHSG